jgi:hypothetical protein
MTTAFEVLPELPRMAPVPKQQKRGRPHNPDPAPEKVVLYVEVDKYIKMHLEQLAKRHNRKLTGEVVQSFQEYLAKFQLWPPPEE